MQHCSGRLLPWGWHGQIKLPWLARVARVVTKIGSGGYVSRTLIAQEHHRCNMVHISYSITTPCALWWAFGMGNTEYSRVRHMEGLERTVQWLGASFYPHPQCPKVLRAGAQPGNLEVILLSMVCVLQTPPGCNWLKFWTVCHHISIYSASQEQNQIDSMQSDMFSSRTFSFSRLSRQYDLN